MTEESKIEVPNFEATSDRKRIFTPKQWFERFRQNTNRKHKMDIIQLIRGAEITQTGWSGKEAEIQKDFIGDRPRSTISNDTSEVQNRSRQNSDKRPYPTIQRIFLTETEHLLLPRRILLDKTNRIRNTRRVLAGTQRKRKRMCIRRRNSRRLPYFIIHDRNYGHKTPRQIDEREKA